MNITMYVDESGDFESKKGDWIVSAAIFEGEHKEIELRIEQLLESEDFPKPGSIHMTDIRKRDYKHASCIANCIISRVIEDLGVKFVSAINYTKNALSTPESTYRLMLLDLIALADVTLQDLKEPVDLHLVIATRTIDRIRTTSKVDIDEYTRRELVRMVEEGLASRGLVDVFKPENQVVEMFPADKSWGLSIADVICNVIYNREKKEADGALVADLCNKNHLRMFESFGGFERRRALIAERDGDYQRAICLWLSEGNRRNPDAEGRVGDLCTKMLNNKSEKAQRADIEALLEKIWRRNKHNDYQELIEQLLPLEHVFEISTSKELAIVRRFGLFRLRNMILLAYNHLGNVTAAEKIVQQQQKSMAQILDDPTNGPIIIDFDILKTDRLFNQLAYDAALNEAKKHAEFVNNYLTCWELFQPGITDDNLKSAHLFVRANSNLARAYTLCGCLTHNSCFQEAERILETLRQTDLSKNDSDRIRCSLCEVYRKTNRADLVLQNFGNTGKTDVTALSPYETAVIVSCLADSCLAGHSDDTDIKELVEHFMEGIQNIVTHPGDVIYRDMALCQYLCFGNERMAMCLLKKAESALEYIKKSNSPIYNLLSNMIVAHRDFINGQMKACSTYFENLPLYNAASKHPNTNNDAVTLRIVRTVSPF